MDGEAETVSGCSHRENNRSYKGFLMDMEDLEETAGSDAEEHSTKRLHQRHREKSKGRSVEWDLCLKFLKKRNLMQTMLISQEQNGSLKNMQHTGSSGTDHHELHGADSSGFLHEHPVCVSQDSWAVRGEEHVYENLLHPCFTAEGSISQRSPAPMLECLVYLNDQHNVADYPINRPANPSVSPVSVRPHHSAPIPSSLTAISTTVSSTVSSMMTSFITDTYSPISFMCGINSSVTDPLMSTSKSPCSSDQSPVSAAAHLHLLGESLALIGRCLQETDKMVCMSSSFSLLLDSLLCALAPLTGLTMHVPELRSCTQHTLASTLENIAYVMPGL